MDLLIEKASTLVSAASIGAVSMHEPLCKRFPEILNVDLKHWNFFVTVAGVFIAATRLNSYDFSEKQKEAIMDVVGSKLKKWNPKGILAFEDCKKLFEKEFDRLKESGHESRFISTDALGIWILWNIFDRPPESELEINLVRIIGVMVVHNFFNWWE